VVEPIAGIHVEDTPANAEPAKNAVELVATFRGLNVDFEYDRSKDTGLDISP
jgi:hypothetical protein